MSACAHAFASESHTNLAMIQPFACRARKFEGKLQRARQNSNSLVGLSACEDSNNEEGGCARARDKKCKIVICLRRVQRRPRPSRSRGMGLEVANACLRVRCEIYRFKISRSMVASAGI
jgi:hypothetical protein